MWARESKAADGTRPGIRESLRWSEGCDRVAEMAPSMPDTRLVYVADGEADIVELMQRAHALGNPAGWLIRSKHNRCLPDGGKLWASGESLCSEASSLEKAMASPASRRFGLALRASGILSTGSSICGQ